jgi:hypothetical protein
MHSVRANVGFNSTYSHAAAEIFIVSFKRGAGTEVSLAELLLFSSSAVPFGCQKGAHHEILVRIMKFHFCRLL